MKRIDVATEYTWNTDDICLNKDEFLSRYETIKSQLDFSEFRGKLTTNDAILNCYDKLYDIYGELEVLAVYAMMKVDENGADGVARELNSLIDKSFGFLTKIFTS